VRDGRLTEEVQAPAGRDLTQRTIRRVKNKLKGREELVDEDEPMHREREVREIDQGEKREDFGGLLELWVKTRRVNISFLER